jgi:hypothetical protein
MSGGGEEEEEEEEKKRKRRGKGKENDKMSSVVIARIKRVTRDSRLRNWRFDVGSARGSLSVSESRQATLLRRAGL